MSTIGIKTAQNIQLELELASVGDRILAYLVDLTIIITYVLSIIIINSIFGLALFDNAPWLVILFFLPAVFYYLISEISLNGQTIGKKSRNIRVVSMDGNPATFGQYMIRWLFRLVDITLTNGMCAILCVALNKNHQRLGDIIAGTVVIKDIQQSSLNETWYVPVTESYKVQFPEVINLKENDIQIIKEVLMKYGNSENPFPLQRTAEKIQGILQIESHLEPYTFLHTILSDYSFLTSRM